MRVHQVTFGMMMGDAISNHLLEIDARLQAWGYETAIYAQHIAPEMVGRVRPDAQLVPYLAAREDVIVYHYSIYSPNTRLFRAAGGRRILVYHNITPARFFHGWDAHQEALCEIGRRTLHYLIDCDLAVGDSEFNRQELIDAGFAAEKTAVLPIFLSLDRLYSLPVDKKLQAQLQQPNTVNWLTVGRIVPNKAIEDVIRIFYHYNRIINPQSRLYVVGSRYVSTYDRALNELVAALGLEECVIFAGRIPDAQLKSYYQSVDLYLCASHHEGFCVPLLESMYFGVPILARKATAVPETLGDAGVLFTGLCHVEVAEMAHLMISDDALRRQIIRKQKDRLRRLSPLRAENALRQVLARLSLPHGAAGK
jgi:glycosyltransferase involved in cell wall biosynthesis